MDEEELVEDSETDAEEEKSSKVCRPTVEAVAHSTRFPVSWPAQSDATLTYQGSR
jgi:hypothetical protein